MVPNQPSTDWHPYRVTRPHDRRAGALTQPQRAVLEALVHLCARPGAEACPRRVAACAGVRFGSAMLTLRHLERQRLAVEHRAPSEADRPHWSPTLVGRSRVRPRSAQAARRPG